MAHLQYMPGDPRLVDQLVYELKSKGIFDQFRKECISDVDTRPAYQNLRQRVENSVSTFLARQCWKPDLNKNQLREKLRKHILDGNYLEQGVERIVDQVVNPKVATVFIPQVEDLVYNYLGIARKKAPETAEPDLLPTDLEAVSPGSVKSDKNAEEDMVVDEPKDKEEKQEKMDVETESTDVQITETVISEDSSMDKSNIPLPTEEIKLENIPAPVNSPPKVTNVELDTIALPQEPNPSTDIPLPEETVKIEKGEYFRPINLHSDDSNTSSDSSLRRNMSPLTPIRNFNNENSCDAQQGFDDSDAKSNDKTTPSCFRFAIENDAKSDNKTDKKEDLSYQFNNQVNINYNTPMYDDSSNSNNLQIDYESDVSKNIEIKAEETSQDKKEKKDEKKSHKSSHRSRDSSRHSKDRKSDSKHSSRDSRHDKKSSSSSKDDKHRSKERERSKDRKGSRDSSKNRSHKSSSKDSKSHRSSSSSHRKDDKKSSRDKDSRSSKDKSRDKSSSKDKDRKSSKDKDKDKDKKKDKKDIDDHYSSSGRGNHGRRSTDRDSNDGSSSSKGTHQNNSKTESKKEKSGTSKSDNTSISGDSTSPSDKEVLLDNSKMSQCKPVVRVDNLEVPIANPPRLPFVPDVTLKKPKFAANLEEAKKLMKMRKFLDEEQKRMNQEAALLLEFQANVRPSLSQVYSSIPGPELEFACVTVPQETCFAPNITEPMKENEILIKDETIIKEDQNKKTEDDSVIKEENSKLNENQIVIKEDEIMKEDIGATNTGAPTENVDISENNEVKIESNQEIVEENTSLLENIEEKESNTTYDENKPFSELMDEIKEYSKASEIKKTDDTIDSNAEESKEEFDLNIEEKQEVADENIEPKKEIEQSEETQINEKPLEIDDESQLNEIDNVENKSEINESVANKYFEVTIITEELSETEEIKEDQTENKQEELNVKENKESTQEFQYFAEHEKYNAELKRHEYGAFLNNYIKNVSKTKMYIINCDTYEEGIVKEIAKNFGEFDVINYYKNGYVKLPTAKNVVNVKLSEEITLPIDKAESFQPLFSPVKSDCSFELNEYDSRLEDINKKSRQEVMEIILGNVVDVSPSKMPKIDYYSEEVQESVNSLKRPIELESVNNNRAVLTPNKIRRLSESDQISSTTEENEESSNNNKVTTTRSKYLGRARRVGLPKPKRCNLSNSPSSDKSVENYAHSPTHTHTHTHTHNGNKPARAKVQRYDTSDLYKPKLHYLSRRNNIS